MENNIKVLVTVDTNWNISDNNNPTNMIKEDRSKFDDLTKNNIVIMDKNMFLEMDNTPLDSRVNIVYSPEDENSYSFNEELNSMIYIANSIEEIDLAINKILSTIEANITVFGHKEIYDLFSEYTDEVYITILSNDSSSLDKYPDPSLDESYMNTGGDGPYTNEENGIVYEFLIYKKIR